MTDFPSHSFTTKEVPAMTSDRTGSPMADTSKTTIAAVVERLRGYYGTGTYVSEVMDEAASLISALEAERDGLQQAYTSTFERAQHVEGLVQHAEIAAERSAARAEAAEARAEKAEAERDTLKKINANLMGDDENLPRYTTRRLKQEIARHMEDAEALNATLQARCPDFVDDPCGSAKCANCGKRRAEHSDRSTLSTLRETTDDQT